MGRLPDLIAVFVDSLAFPATRFGGRWHSKPEANYFLFLV
jgi:hypothetical protein